MPVAGRSIRDYQLHAPVIHAVLLGDHNIILSACGAVYIVPVHIIAAPLPLERILHTFTAGYFGLEVRGGAQAGLIVIPAERYVHLIIGRRSRNFFSRFFRHFHRGHFGNGYCIGDFILRFIRRRFFFRRPLGNGRRFQDGQRAGLYRNAGIINRNTRQIEAADIRTGFGALGRRIARAMMHIRQIAFRFDFGIAILYRTIGESCTDSFSGSV